jgi:hypothetical protein
MQISRIYLDVVKEDLTANIPYTFVNLMLFEDYENYCGCSNSSKQAVHESHQHALVTQYAIHLVA